MMAGSTKFQLDLGFIQGRGGDLRGLRHDRSRFLAWISLGIEPEHFDDAMNAPA